MRHCGNPDCPVPPVEQQFYPGQWRCIVCSKAHATAWVKANRKRWNAQRRARYAERKRARLAARLEELRIGIGTE